MVAPFIVPGACPPLLYRFRFFAARARPVERGEHDPIRCRNVHLLIRNKNNSVRNERDACTDRNRIRLQQRDTAARLRNASMFFINEQVHCGSSRSLEAISPFEIVPHVTGCATARAVPRGN